MDHKKHRRRNGIYLNLSHLIFMLISFHLISSNNLRQSLGTANCKANIVYSKKVCHYFFVWPFIKYQSSLSLCSTKKYVIFVNVNAFHRWIALDSHFRPQSQELPWEVYVPCLANTQVLSISNGYFKGGCNLVWCKEHWLLRLLSHS